MEITKEQFEKIQRLIELDENPQLVISEQLDEIRETIEEVESMIEGITLPEVINGENGVSPDKDEIVNEVLSKIPPTKEVNKEEIITEVLSRIPPTKIIEKTETIKELPTITEITQVVDETAVVAKIENDLPKLGEKIRDGLELIIEEDEKLKIEAVGYLRKELDELKKLIKKSETVFVGGGSGGRVVKSYDLTPLLNGSTKTFTLPAFWRIISIHSTSFPFTFRETTDWTSNASNMSITFTSEVDETTILASGQTLTVIYSE